MKSELGAQKRYAYFCNGAVSIHEHLKFFFLLNFINETKIEGDTERCHVKSEVDQHKDTSNKCKNWKK